MDEARNAENEKRIKAAREKVVEINARLQLLHLLASANPRAAAKMAGQLSQELGQAVREYSDAGGQGSSGAGSAPQISSDLSHLREDDPSQPTPGSTPTEDQIETWRQAAQAPQDTAPRVTVLTGTKAEQMETLSSGDAFVQAVRGIAGAIGNALDTAQKRAEALGIDRDAKHDMLQARIATLGVHTALKDLDPPVAIGAAGLRILI